MGLPRENRFSLRHHTNQIFASGNKFSLKYFYGFYLSDDNLSAPKLAITVPKKVAQKASDRNRIRRLTSEAIRPHISSLKSGYYLIFPQKNILSAPFTEIVADIVSYLKKSD